MIEEEEEQFAAFEALEGLAFCYRSQIPHMVVLSPYVSDNLLVLLVALGESRAVGLASPLLKARNNPQGQKCSNAPAITAGE